MNWKNRINLVGLAVLAGTWAGKRAGGLSDKTAGRLYAAGALLFVGGALYNLAQYAEGEAPDGKLWLTVEDADGNVAAGGDDEASPGNSDGLFPAWTHPDLWGVL